MIPSITQYLSKEAVQSLVKRAEERSDHPIMRGVKTIGTSLGGMALGAGAGLGVAYGADRLFGQKLPMKYLTPAVGLLGMGAGLAETAMREKQMQEMRDAIQKYKAKSRKS